MATKNSIYKSANLKQQIYDLYDQKLAGLSFPVKIQDIETSFGQTRVMFAGNEKGKQIVLFHGVHAGAPLTLESVQLLMPDHHLICIETIGQATKSADVSINIKDNSFAVWADEVLNKLYITKADFIGISYGAYILQKLISHRPEKVNKCIFIVPSGLANGKFWPSFTKLSIPLMKFLFTKKDRDLKKFVAHFVPEDDLFMFEFQKNILLGLNMDYRRPSILKPENVAHFTNPVYMILAENDVFFPANKTTEKAKEVFKNLKEIFLLKNSKHMPKQADLYQIQQKLMLWLSE